MSKSKKTKCGVCQGTGKVIPEVNGNFDSKKKKEKCKHCDGKGKIDVYDFRW